jgi:hypothetical protein
MAKKQGEMKKDRDGGQGMKKDKRNTPIIRKDQPKKQGMFKTGETVAQKTSKLAAMAKLPAYAAILNMPPMIVRMIASSGGTRLCTGSEQAPAIRTALAMALRPMNSATAESAPAEAY